MLQFAIWQVEDEESKHGGAGGSSIVKVPGDVLPTRVYFLAERQKIFYFLRTKTFCYEISCQFSITTAESIKMKNDQTSDQKPG